MTKLRKQRRRKVYRHSVNRKRLRNKITSNGKITCQYIKDAWVAKHSVQKNMAEMGLCHNPNKMQKWDPSKRNQNIWKVEDVETEPLTSQPSKTHVLDALKKDANAPRAKLFRLPKGEVEYLEYMLTTYGFDFEAMTKDRKNYNQYTWRQFRQKVKRFQAAPTQYQQFIANADQEVLAKLNETTHYHKL